ncbi:T9SS type A sorting domain-containing protein [Chryseobacterium sp. Mn2064]|uniref:T9SS type A sorting domain-containing protein n=1 Tax=Chryseobacterium sp. Mn2064 TaxID=3395263 RepID=UPI003BBB7275
MINRLFLCLGIFFTGIFVAAQNQFLDPTFGANGVVTYSPGNNFSFNYESGIITPQNKIIVSGSYSSAPNSDNITNLIQRLNADGSVDTSFNTLVIPPFNYNRFIRMALQSDQKILLGDISGRKIIRLNENGTYDTGFGDNGAVHAAIFEPYFSANGIDGPHRLSSMFITNNKILLCMGAYMNQESKYVIMRLNENGSIDSTFGNNGIVILQDCFLGRLVLQNDSKLVFVGQRENGTFVKSRFTANGVLDSTYNNNDLQYTPPGTYETNFFSAAGKDNNVYMYGFTSSTAGDNLIILMKLNQNGEFDTSFGTNGIVIEPYYNNNTIYSAATNINFATILLDNNNDIFVVNMASPNGNAADMNQVVKKFKPNGTVDAGFGNNGVVDIDLNYRESVRSAILTPDQKIMIFGNHQTPSKGIITKVLNNANALSVKNQEIKKDNVSIYPNPVKDILNIKNAKSKDLPIEIVDASGRSILKTIVNENKVDISHLEKGIYYLNTGNTTHKFIKE